MELSLTLDLAVKAAVVGLSLYPLAIMLMIANLSLFFLIQY